MCDKRGKLSLRFIRPLEILERVGNIAYRLAYRPACQVSRRFFHVSMLQRYTPDPTDVVDWGEIEVDTDGTFKKGPMCIMNSREQVL